MSMNESTAIFLISDEIRAVEATYESDDDACPKLFKTFDLGVAVGDYVVVPTDTRHHMTVCKITSVDLDIDVETTQEVKWIIGTVDPADYEDLKRQEQNAVTMIKHAQKRKRRQEMREALLDAQAEQELKGLTLYNVDKDESQADTE